MESFLILSKQLALLFTIPTFTCLISIGLFRILSKGITPRLLLPLSLVLILLSFGISEFLVFNYTNGSEALGILLFIFMALPIPLSLITLFSFGLKNKIGILASIVTIKTLVLMAVSTWANNAPLIYILLTAIEILLFREPLLKRDFFAQLLVSWDIVIAISWFLIGTATSPLVNIFEILLIGNSLIPMFIAAIHSIQSLRPLFYPKNNFIGLPENE